MANPFLALISPQLAAQEDAASNAECKKNPSNPACKAADALIGTMAGIQPSITSGAVDFLGTLSSSVVPFAKCMAEKVGYVKLAALVAAAASGAGSVPLIAAIQPYLIPCGALAISGQLGSSPFELAVKEALSKLAPGEFDALVATYLQGGYTVQQAMQLATLATNDQKAAEFFGSFIETKEEFADIGQGKASWQQKPMAASAAGDKLLIPLALVALLVVVR